MVSSPRLVLFLEVGMTSGQCSETRSILYPVRCVGRVVDVAAIFFGDGFLQSIGQLDFEI